MRAGLLDKAISSSFNRDTPDAFERDIRTDPDLSDRERKILLGLRGLLEPKKR